MENEITQSNWVKKTMTGFGLVQVLLFCGFPEILPFDAKMVQVGSIGFLMILWWISEILPLGITALLPLVLFPVFGLADLKKVAESYGDPVIFLFMGGFMLALAMEKHKLHIRVALMIIAKVGKNGNSIILGFMLATAFLSMWISNTATAVMMLPIANSVIYLVTQKSNDLKSNQAFTTAMLLSIAFAANIGGIATPIGTPPNSVAVGFLSKTYHYDMSFVAWMGFAFPIAILLLLATYFLLVKVFFRNNFHDLKSSQHLIGEELQLLGKMSSAEKRVMIVFLGMAFLWITRVSLKNFLSIQLEDAMIAVAGGVLLFLLPTSNTQPEKLLVWSDTKEIPWGILLLFGGGLCLADMFYQVGMVKVLGELISSWHDVNLFFIVFGVAFIAIFVTEVMSNVALTTIMLPVLAAVSSGIEQNPLWLITAVTIGASCAFMLPMATPPNAIVFASGKIRVNDMIKVGFVLNLFSIVIVSVLIFFLLPIFTDAKIDVFPTWAVK